MSPRRQNFVTYQPTIRKSGSLPATLFGLTLLAGLFTPLSIQNGVRAAEGPNLVIVVDSSGSMWGRMGKITKAEAARNAVRDFVGQLPPQSRVGVMAYGHLQKQSCSAAKMISPIAKPDPARAVRALSRIRPKGRTPIATALEQAAKSLNYKKTKATIVLLSDGYENCKRNPCEMARTLRKAGQDLTIHVIGINLNENDQRRLQCVATNTNGLFANAGAQLELAASLNAVLIALDAGSAWVKKEPKKDGPKAQGQGGAGLHLRAVLNRGGAPLKSGVIWRIFGDKVDSSGQRQELKRYAAATPRINLSPGRYFVEANYGLVRTGRELTVSSSQPTNTTFVLNAGTIRLTSVENDERVPLNRVLYQLFDVSSGEKPVRKAISRSTDGTAIFHVPSGTYRITAEHGYARLEQAIEISAGAISELTLNMNIGTLELSGAAAPGGAPLKRMVYRVEKISDQTGSVEREVLRTAAHNPRIRLPSGEYLIHATHDLAKTSERATVQPGRITRKIINMNAGALRISSKFSGSANKFKDRVSYKIFASTPQFDGERREIARTTRLGKTFRLNVGHYIVAGQLGNLNATVEANVTVEAGKLTDVALVHKAGLVSLSLVKRPGGQPEQNVFWLLLDNRGRELWRTSRPTPRFALAKGRYRAVAEISGKRLEKKFTIASGQEKKIELAVK